jgi:hypothetical protein
MWGWSVVYLMYLYIHVFICKCIYLFYWSYSSLDTGDKQECSKEDDVWVVGSMFDAVSNRACVGIFDGDNLAKGM